MAYEKRLEQEKLKREQILSAWEHSRNDLLEREKQQISEKKKLTFNIAYYPAFQNVTSITEELHLILTPKNKHMKLFPNETVLGFRNGKSHKDYLVRAKLLKLEVKGRCKTCQEKNCLVCDSISATATFLTEAYQESFQVPKICTKNCHSKKVLYLLKCKVCGEVPYTGKTKTKFCYRLNNYRRSNQKE